MPVARRTYAIRVACAAAALLCGSCDDSTAPRVSSVIVRAPADSLFFGDSLQFVAVATGDSATVAAPRFAWASSDTTVAIVDSLGMVLGVGSGSATISADFDGRRDEFLTRVIVRRVDGGVSFASMSRGISSPLCAIAVDGAPFCGAQPNDPPAVFAALPENRGLIFSSFSTGNNSRCGLTNNGLMYCWGTNSHGHFGNGMSSSFRADTAPALGAHGRTFTALSIGGHTHTCGVNRADSVVYCFGHDDFNQVGRGSPLTDDTLVAPTGGAPRGRYVTTEDSRSCLIDMEGRAMCWGGSVVTPALVPAPEPLVSVQSGWGQTCALAVSRTLYCWGSNSQGETGVGSTDFSIATPTPVAGGLKFENVFAGYQGTCALTADGELYCWGSFLPLSVSRRLQHSSPVRVLPTLRFKSVASGFDRACGVTVDGKLLCW